MAPDDAAPLRTELARYKALLPELLAQPGRFALIHGENLLGVYSTWEDACQEGYAKLGPATPFLVKRIEEHDRVNFYTRRMEHHAPCRT